MRNRVAARGVALILLLAAAGAAIWFSPLGRYVNSPAVLIGMREHGAQWWAIPLFFIAYAVLDIFFIPTQFLSITAVLTWGWFRGGVIELFAATLGAVPPYLIARSFLREWFSERLESHRRAAALLEEEGFTLLLLLRVVPIIPYTALNYVAGLSSLPLPRYVLATFIGILPSTFIFAWFVESIARGVVQPRGGVFQALAAGALLAAMIIATRLAASRLRRRVEPADRTTSPPDAAHHDSNSAALPPG